ncbi:hypothetical protein AB0I60_20500 [Actinosynnema sp. NPDC050436]|uniref:hypothetical protein n=1 Tax=Actinosynnema sp. NPDC050436 TaxID=3155659 RepID=UPI0033F714FE
MTGEIDQLQFDFGDAFGSLDAQASSYPPEMEAYWADQFRQHHRLVGFSDGAPPERAFSYFEFENSKVAVLFRCARPDDAGRNFSHALIGERRFLANLALPLTQWRHWPTSSGARARLAKLSPSLLHDETSDHRLDEAARYHALPAAGLLAALLDDPDGHLSVVGAPDSAVAPVLWAVRDVMAVVAAGTSWRRPWTFSTHEVEDEHRDHLPSLLFLPGAPLSGPAPGRVRVPFLGGDQPLHVLANRLLAHYRDDGSAGLREAVQPLVRYEQDLSKRVAVLLDAFTRVAAPPPPQPPVEQPPVVGWDVPGGDPEPGAVPDLPGETRTVAEPEPVVRTETAESVLVPVLYGLTERVGALADAVRQLAVAREERPGTAPDRPAPPSPAVRQNQAQAHPPPHYRAGYDQAAHHHPGAPRARSGAPVRPSGVVGWLADNPWGVVLLVIVLLFGFLLGVLTV